VEQFPDYTTDANGYLTLDIGSLPLGTYNIRTKGPRNLAVCGSVTLIGDPATSVDAGVQPGGDANDTNIVNAVDYNMMRGAFGTGYGQSNYDARADFDNNDVVNTTDFNLIRANFGSAGCSDFVTTRSRPRP